MFAMSIFPFVNIFCGAGFRYAIEQTDENIHTFIPVLKAFGHFRRCRPITTQCQGRIHKVVRGVLKGAESICKGGQLLKKVRARSARE